MPSKAPAGHARAGGAQLPNSAAPDGGPAGHQAAGALDQVATLLATGRQDEALGLYLKVGAVPNKHGAAPCHAAVTAGADGGHERAGGA